MIEKIITVDRVEHAIELFGNLDYNMDMIRERLSVKVTMRDGEIKVSGEENNVEMAVKAIGSLIDLIKEGEPINEQNIDYVLSLVTNGNEESIKEITNDVVAITAKGKPIKPKTLGQKEYVNAIRNHTITLGIGPAGTGKTFLAVALAARAFKSGDISRIILTRPAVEAGEKLGFLPGDLQTKVDPYLRPLYDALFEMFGEEGYNKFFERGLIEIAPLAYMRGRTLENSFIILDEAQNTTQEQMKMFLTRLGAGSKIVITGDITQIDLPNIKSSGLIQAMKVLENIDDIYVHNFTDQDIVRHKLVQKIVVAYEKYNNERRSDKNEQQT